MTHPLMYIVPIVVGVGAFIFFTITNQRERQNLYEATSNRRKRYVPNLDSEYDAPSNGTCTICLEQYDEAINCQKVRCGHIFHHECYLRLLENR
uniref:CSON005058 protein n=1 Tax=Culicoides sonorensis TaxID=179676 RepID=A0A336L5F2_CULSO